MERSCLVSRLVEAAGDVVIPAILRRGADAQAQLLHHVSFLGPDPDPVMTALLATGNSRLLEESVGRFLYPGEVVSGPYSEYLKDRRALLERWVVATPELTPLAEAAIPSLDDWIAREELREAEDDWG